MAIIAKLVLLPATVFLVSCSFCDLCHSQEQDPATRTASELLRQLDSREWGDVPSRIDYVARYLQDGAPAVATCRLEWHPSLGLALWRLDRIDPSENGLTHVYARNPECAFHLVRTPNSNSWQLKEFRSPGKELWCSVPEACVQRDPGECIDNEYEMLTRLPFSPMPGKSFQWLGENFDVSFRRDADGLRAISGKLRPNQVASRGVKSFEVVVDPKTDWIVRCEIVGEKFHAKGVCRNSAKDRIGDIDGFHWQRTTTNDATRSFNTEVIVTAVSEGERPDDLWVFDLSVCGLSAPTIETTPGGGQGID